jgi:hypothetical protein
VVPSSQEIFVFWLVHVLRYLRVCLAQILHLVGIKYLYQLNVFVYCMFFFVGATILVLMIRGPAKWKRVSQEERYAAAYAG